MNIAGFDNFEQIGEGGMAVVWKAHQVSLERDVAIKILKSELSSNPEEIADFVQEAKSAASLKHPNIIQVYDASEQEGIYYFVMEYIAGQTVEQALENGSIHWKKVAQIGLTVAEALEYAWNKVSLIHRDIKPSNIMFDDDGTIKVADLGLAKRMDTASLAEQIQIRKLEGTPNYMSPEQARCRNKLDCRTDMYSLGATMYHMVTGRLPFEEYSEMEALEMHVTGKLANPRDIMPSIPMGICQLISRLMMKDPDDRFSDWSEAIKDFKKIVAGRVMVTKQGKGAESTVSLPEKKASDTMIGRRTPKPEELPPPAWLRATAWSVLGLWWIYIAFAICKQPPVPSLPKPFSTEIRKTAPVVAVTAGNQRLPAKSPAVTQPTGTVVAAKVKTEPDVDKPAPGTIQATDGMQASNEEQLLLHSLKSKLVDSILNQSYSEALTFITQERQYSHSPAFDAEMAKMEDCIGAMSGKGDALETAIKSRIGRETTVRIKGNDWPIIIRSIEDGVLKVDLKSQIGSEVKLRPGTLTVAQLDPADCIKWIGTPDTEAKCLAIFMLSFRNRDFKTALKVAEKCGPFAESFKARVELEAGNALSPQ